MHLVGFIIRIYHDAPSPERQKHHQVSQNNKQGQHYAPGGLTFIRDFYALSLLRVVFITIILSAVQRFNDALGPQKWERKAELRMLSISMVCLSKSEGQHVAIRPLAPTSSSFLKTKLVRVDDLV